VGAALAVWSLKAGTLQWLDTNGLNITQLQW
jgi:hypothetical protein